jgi:hypothetical protein
MSMWRSAACALVALACGRIEYDGRAVDSSTVDTGAADGRIDGADAEPRVAYPSTLLGSHPRP